MYGPAVRCKGKRELESTVLHQCIRPRVGAYAPDHHGNPRAPELISGHASKGLCGSSVLGCAGKTISPSLVFLSQTSVGKGSCGPYIAFLLIASDRRISRIQRVP